MRGGESTTAAYMVDFALRLPHMRGGGSLPTHTGPTASGSVFPTCVGVSLSLLFAVLPSPFSPHAWGWVELIDLICKPSSAFSPHAWGGSHTERPFIRPSMVVFPTCVGVSRQSAELLPEETIVFPTCVGVGRKWRSLRLVKICSFPHMRGGGSLSRSRCGVAHAASSPHAWGFSTSPIAAPADRAGPSPRSPQGRALAMSVPGIHPRWLHRPAP